MIALSPYTESAPIETAYISASPPQKAEPEREEPDEPGKFAEILAGLLGKPELEKAPASGEAENVSLAGTDEISTHTETGGEGLTVSKEKKNPLFEKRADTAKGSGEAEEFPAADSVEANENILFGAELLVARRDTRGPGEAAPADIGVESVSWDDAGEIEPEPPNAAELTQADGAETVPETGADAGADFAQIAEIARGGQTAGDETNSQFDTKEDDGEESVADLTFSPKDADADSGRVIAGERAGAQLAGETAAAKSEEKKGRLEEVRDREKKGERLSVEVSDRRSNPANGELPADTDVRVNAAATDGQDGAGSGEITLELRLSEQGNKGPAQTSWENRAGQAFENMLARELHENFNNDIVRHASMILRDEGRGTIRLALRPESLGNVKISLEMAENKITGHIVVESEEALRAFEKEIASLEQAFKDSGFEGAELEMSLAQDGGGARQFRDETQTRALLSTLAAASMYEAEGRAETPLAETARVGERGQGAINMLA